MDESTLKNKKVSIKIVGVEHARQVNLKSWIDNGIWVQDETLHSELAHLAKDPAAAGFLEMNPWIFLPIHRLEWVMIAAKVTHSTV